MSGLLSFDGRTRRRDWWIYNIVVGLIGYVASQVIAPLALGEEGRIQIDPAAPFSPVYPVPLLIMMLAISAIFVWPSLAIAARRTHDRGNSAKVNLVLIVVCMALSWTSNAVMAGLLPGLESLKFASMGVNLLAGLYLLVVLGFLDGTPGPNAYGPSPKGLGSQEAHFT